MIKSSHIITPKTARYFSLGDIDKKTKVIWIVLHGYGQNAYDFIKCFKTLNKKSVSIIAPEGLSRFYKEGYSGNTVSSWMTKDDRLNEIKDYLNYLELIFHEINKQAPNASISLLGFSQGVATACRWALSTKMNIKKLILWAGSVPPEFKWGDLTKKYPLLRLYIVWGNNDPFIKKTYIKKLKSYIEKNKINARFYSFQGGHQLNSEAIAIVNK